MKEKTTRNFSEYLTPRSIVLCLILLGLLFFSRYVLCKNHVPKPHKCHIICTSNTYLKNCRCIYNSHLNICGGCNILNIHGQTTHPPWSTWPSCLCYTSYTDLILVCIKGSPDFAVMWTSVTTQLGLGPRSQSPKQKLQWVILSVLITPWCWGLVCFDTALHNWEWVKAWGAFIIHSLTGNLMWQLLWGVRW